VLFKIPNLEDISETSLQKVLGPVVSERIKLADGNPPSKHSPKEVIQPASFSGLGFNSLKEIAIVGFGKAIPEITPPPTLQCPLNIFPPEVLFSYPASKKSDIWQLACLMCFIHTGTFLFQTEPFYEHLVCHITNTWVQYPATGQKDTDGTSTSLLRIRVRHTDGTLLRGLIRVSLQSR
jgi:serine/threonine protein kinase